MNAVPGALFAAAVCTVIGLIVVAVVRLITRDLRDGMWRFVDDDTRRMQQTFRKERP